MIVISGALVLVALVLLVIGLIQPDLAFVYASIGVSLASFVFLVIGIIQRRREDLPSEDGAVAASGQDAGVVPTVSPMTSGAAPRRSAVEPTEVLREDASGTVLVVEGRPRYHVEDCRYLAGKQAKAVAVGNARDEGFTACGVCKPDLALEPAAATAPSPTLAVSLNKPPVEEAPTAVQELAQPVVATKVARIAKAPAKTAPVRTAAVKVAPSKAAAVKGAPAKAVPVKKVAAAPAKAAAVIVIPDRGKFHTPGCRYVRGAEGALELTKAAATKQGYDACGVCKP